MCMVLTVKPAFI